jgi:hypothetical protein
MNLYGCDELGTIATLGGHELRAKLVPARGLDHATVEVCIEGVPRATTQIARRSLLSADIGTIRQLENRVSSLPRHAADVESRRQELSPGSNRQRKHWRNRSSTPTQSKPPSQLSTHRPTHG